MSRFRTPVTLVASLTSVLFGVATVAACSAGSTAPEGSAAATSSAAATGRGGGGGQRQPGVSGLIAAVSGSTMQVQTQSKQTAVSWSATTAFTKQDAGTAADLTVGACVAVRPVGGTTATGDSVPAGTVQIAPTAADGTCAGGFGGAVPPAGAGGGTPPSGAPTGMPRASEAPSGTSTGAPGQGGPDGRGGGAGFFGKVTAVTGGSFTLARIVPAGEGATSTATPVTVTTSSTTAYTKTVKASAADVVVGQCTTAQGQTSETGAVTATMVALRAPVGGSCFGAGGGSTGGGATGG